MMRPGHFRTDIGSNVSRREGGAYIDMGPRRHIAESSTDRRNWTGLGGRDGIQRSGQKSWQLTLSHG